MNLLVEARKLRKELKDLTEDELNIAVMEVLNCYAPFYPPGDLESIMFESKKGDSLTLSPQSDQFSTAVLRLRY